MYKEPNAHYNAYVAHLAGLDCGQPDCDECEPDYPEVRCWVCDAIANPILDADGNFTGGTDCGCDDIGYADGSDGIWY